MDCFVAFHSESLVVDIFVVVAVAAVFVVASAVVDAVLEHPFPFAAAVLDLIDVFDLKERIAVAVAVADIPAIVPHLSCKAFAVPRVCCLDDG